MRESSGGSVYALPFYLTLLCSLAGGRARYLVVRHNGEAIGGVALHEQDGRAGTFALPRPLLYYNGVVLKDHATKYPSERTARDLKVTSALASALSGRGYARLELRNRSSVLDARPFLEAGYGVSPSYTYVVRIADPAEAWSRVEQNLRRLVRRCDRDGMVLSEDDDFPSFFALHEASARRRGIDPYLPRDAFRRYFEALRAADLCRLFHCRLPDGRAVASQLVLLGPGDASHTAAAASTPEHAARGANAFLRWKVFEALAALGVKANDLTDAGMSGVAHFKSQLGGDLTPCLVISGRPSLRSRVADGLRRLVRRGREGSMTAGPVE